MADIIKVYALGGLDENGRDCYVVEINDDIFVLDCGFALPDKTIPGVDYILPNAEYLIKNKSRIRAYIMTHGHDESMGALKYFYESAPAPIYCSLATRKCMEGQLRLQGQKVKFNFVEVEPSSKFFISGREFTFFQVCHNAADSSGVAILTDQGYIVYTSDFIVDYSVKEKGFIFDLKALETITDNPTLLLMSESKAATKEGYCSPKHRIPRLIEKHFAEDDKRIFISCFWQNFFRINEIFTLCRANNKKVYAYNEYTRRVVLEISNALPDIVRGVEFVSKEDLLRVRNKDLVILMLGYGGELYDEMVSIAYGTNEDKRIVLGPDDLFISAALATPTLETKCTRAIDALYRTGCSVQWIKNKDVVSMHARQDDLKFFLSFLKPKYYLPVRGNFLNLMANAKLALSMGIGLNHMNVFIMDNGMQLVFDGQRPRIIQQVDSGINVAPILVDGTGIGKVAEELVSDRMELSQDGVVVIAASVSLSEKKIIAGPDCQMRGFVFVKEAEPLLKSISNIFVSEINTALQLEKFDIEAVKEVIADRSKKFIRRENGRQPYVLPIIHLV